MVSNYILARHLGIAVFGIYSGMLSVVFIINLITDWGFNAYGSQMLAQQQESSKSMFITKALSFKIVLSIFFSVIYLIFCFVKFGSNWYYLLGTPLILLSFLNPEWICRGILMPHLASYRQLIFSVFNICCFALVYFLRLPKIMVFLLYGFSMISSCWMILMLVKKHLPFRLLDTQGVFDNKEILKNTSMYFYGYLVNNVNYTGGIIVLTIFSIPETVGAYSSYYTIFSTVVSPIIIVYGLFAPKVSSLPAQQFYTKYFKTVINVLAVGTILYINGGILYGLFYPKTFLFNHVTNILVSAVFVMYCLENMFTVNAILVNEPKIYFRINLLGLVVNALCFCYLIASHNLSAQSAFISLLVSQVLMFVVSSYSYSHLLKYLFNKETLFVVIVLIGLIGSQFAGSVKLVYTLSGLALTIVSLRTFFLIKNLY